MLPLKLGVLSFAVTYFCQIFTFMKILCLVLVQPFFYILSMPDLAKALVLGGRVNSHEQTYFIHLNLAHLAQAIMIIYQDFC